MPLPEKAAIRKSVIATEAVRAALAYTGTTVTVTVVPVYAEGEPATANRAVTFDDVRIVLE